MNAHQRRLHKRAAKRPQRFYTEFKGSKELPPGTYNAVMVKCKMDRRGIAHFTYKVIE